MNPAFILASIIFINPHSILEDFDWHETCLPWTFCP